MSANLKSLAANRLSDGITVWASRTASGFAWVEDWAQVIPVSAQGDVDGLETFAALAASADEIISERVIDVAETASGEYYPQRFREQIVAAGPSNRTDLGKQAEFAPRRVAA